MIIKKKSLLILVFVISVYLLVGCSGSEEASKIISESGGAIHGTVTNNSTPEEGVKVTVIELDRSDITDSHGTYNFEDVDEGSYKLKFSKENIIEQVRTIVVAGGSNSTVNIDITESQSAADVKNMVSSINEHGILLKKTDQQQLDRLSSTGEEISSYLQPVGSEFYYTLAVMDAFMNVDDWYENPGEYTWDEWDTEDGEISFNEGTGTEETWTLTIPNYYDDNSTDTVIIKILNKDEIEEVVDGYTVFNFTKANFQYTHFTGDAESTPFMANFFMDFAEMSNETEKITNEGSKEKYIIPVDFIFILTGQINSERSYDGLDQGIGTVKVKLTTDMDFVTEDERHIGFSGSFTSDVVSLDGEFNIALSNTTISEIKDGANPVPTSIEIIGGVTTKVAEIEGSIVINNLDDATTIEESNLKDITFTGLYRGIDDPDTTDDEEVVAEGEFKMIPNYNDVSIINVLTYNGSINSGGFQPINLTCKATQKEESGTTSLDSTMTLTYGINQYLTGSVIDHPQNGYTLSFVNERGLNIDINIKDEDTVNDQEIGEITDSKGNVLAEIRVLDYQWEVDIVGGETVSLLY